MAKSILQKGNIIEQRINFINDDGKADTTKKTFLLLQKNKQCPECSFRQLMGSKIEHTRAWTVIYLETGQTINLCEEELKNHKKFDESDSTWAYFFHRQVG